MTEQDRQREWDRLRELLRLSLMKAMLEKLVAQSAKLNAQMDEFERDLWQAWPATDEPAS